jgi:sugar phosphate isomerase/epimerase
MTYNMTRRKVLTFSGAALAGGLGGHLAFGNPPPSGTVRFGVRTPLPNVSLRERALIVKETGYDGIELGREWLNQPVEALKKELDGTGVVVSAIVGSPDLLDTDAEKRASAIEVERHRLQMAKDLGAELLITVPVTGANRFQDLSPLMDPREIEERLLIAAGKQLVGDVERSGITVIFEPLNRKETHFMRLQSQAAKVIQCIGSPGFGILSDFYHMQLEEPDIGETLSQYGQYTRYVHLADGEKRTEPGSLPFDYRPGFRALKKHGFSGWLTMEARVADNPEAALRRALKYIKDQWAEA